MTFAYINNPKHHTQNEELKSVYNKWRQRQFGKRMPIHVFGSGSEGNSVYLKLYHTLIDLGMPYKHYMDYSPTFFLDVDYIILTHHHGDHLNPSTLTRILNNHPHIKIIITNHMWDILISDEYRPEYIKRDVNEITPFGHNPEYKTDARGQRLVKPSKLAETFIKHHTKFITAEPKTLRTHTGKTVLFEPLTVKHGDIVNLAIQLFDPELDFNFLYASDLDNLDGTTEFTDSNGNVQRVTGLNQNRLYTCMFLEANYDEAILAQWYANLSEDDPDFRAKKARADGNKRHISEQEAGQYIEKYLADDGIFVPLHASRTFGTFRQD